MTNQVNNFFKNLSNMAEGPHFSAVLSVINSFEMSKRCSITADSQEENMGEGEFNGLQ